MMAFREKIAWLTLVAMLVAYGVYFSCLPAIVAHDAVPMAQMTRMLGLFAAVTIAQLVFVIVVSAVMAIRAGREANARADERERAIARRGSSLGYFVLMVGTIVAGVVMPFSHSALAIVNAALLALVVAEAVRYATVIASYRRGWHG